MNWYNNGYNVNQANYNVNSGYPQQEKTVHLQRHLLQDIISQYLMSYGIQVSAFEKIDEFPESLRHSCVNTGITFLSRNEYTLPQGYDVSSVPVYFCNQCGKVYLPQDIRGY